MKKTIFALIVGMMLIGCDEQKHLISISKLSDCQEINVLYVFHGEHYRLGTQKSSIIRLVRGGAYYKLDLSKIKSDKREATKDESVKVWLPRLKIEPQPDPFRSQEYRPKAKFLVNDTGLNRIREKYDEMDRAKIAAAANQSEYIKMAKEQAEEIVRKMLHGLKVEIEWEE